MCISVKARWKEDILQYSEIIPGRAQFVLFQVKNVQFGCLNVYAPNRVVERIEFWL